MSSSSTERTLIANPKRFKDWENNKLYYRERFFSKKQKEVVIEIERKNEIAYKHIATRQPHDSGIDGGFKPKLKKKKPLKNKMDSGEKEDISINSSLETSQCPIQFAVVSEGILKFEVDDWEELCFDEVERVEKKE